MFRSVIVNHLERNLKRQDVGVTYVYCNYKEQGQSASSLVSSILQQLVEQQHKISYNISVLHQTYLRKQTQPTLAERSSSLHLELRRFSKVFLLVDAMDECTEIEGTRGIFLRELQRLPSNVQLLVTSRYNPNIERYFDDVPRLEILASDFDVKWYLESQILDQPRLASYVETDPSLKKAIIDTIVKLTNGMWVYYLPLK
jgi:ankyrin repeat domain-containing protein 50